MKKFIFGFLVLFSVTAAQPSYALVDGPTSVFTATAGASALALPYNGLRGYLILVNTGLVTAYVSFNASQAQGTGIPIPAGGNYEPFIAPTSAVYIGTNASTTTVTMMEGQ